LFSIGVAVTLQPIRFQRKPWVAFVFIGLGVTGWGAVQIFSHWDASALSNWLFFYGRVGEPPAWPYIAGPILLASLLLWLGSVFHERLEL
jgi:hypothetical protein